MPNSVIKGLIKQSKKSEKEVEKIWSEAKSIYMDDTGKKESEFKEKDWATITTIAKRKLGIKESVENSWIKTFLESPGNAKTFFEGKLEEKNIELLNLWKELQKLKIGDKLEVKGIFDKKAFLVEVVYTIEDYNKVSNNKNIQEIGIISPKNKAAVKNPGSIAIYFNHDEVVYHKTALQQTQLVDYIIIKGRTFNFKESTITNKDALIQESSFEQINLKETQNNHEQKPHDSVTFSENDLKGKKNGMYLLKGGDHTHEFIISESEINKLNDHDDINVLATGIDHNHKITISYYGVYKENIEEIDETVISANLNIPEPIKEPYEDPDKEAKDDEEEEVDEEVSSFSSSGFGGSSRKTDKDKKKKDK